MLNRRILRIKAFKVMYEYAVRGGMTLEDALSELDRSCEATRDLYLFMLAVIGPLRSEARKRIDAARSKINPTEEDLHPNEKFADNLLAPLFEQDRDFQKLITKKKLSWEQYDIFIRHVLDSITASDYYNKYMEREDRSLKEDCALFRKIYENEFEDNQELLDILEDMSIYWPDDLGYALIWDCRTMDDLGKGGRWRLPELYQSEETRRRHPEADVQSDRAFVRKLLTCAFTGYEAVFNKVIEAVPDWDKDRLFSADMAIIALGVAEANNFPDIPRRVTLDEYVEISKYYCSPKSRQFVNGLLDRLTREDDGKDENNKQTIE